MENATDRQLVHSSVNGSATPKTGGPGAERIAFVCLLVAANVALLGWAGYRCFRPPSSSGQNQMTQPPAQYDVAQDAQDYLRCLNIKPLSGPLQQLLTDDSNSIRVPTQTHSLLGKSAPQVNLQDTHDQTWDLKGALAKGPVLLVFYHGYSCSHCVGQLFALNKDVEYFRELGVEIVAVSADKQELTLERFSEYGEFSFPVLSDPDNRLAQTYGVFIPAKRGVSSILWHGTFVIDRAGTVRWSNCGDSPFTDNRTLLYELAAVEGRLPNK